MKRVKALPRHAVDDHSQCDYHPPMVCSCGACRNKEAIECKGKAYKTRFRLDCKFHALLYEIECHERANQAEELIHPSSNGVIPMPWRHPIMCLSGFGQRMFSYRGSIIICPPIWLCCRQI